MRSSNRPSRISESSLLIEEPVCAFTYSKNGAAALQVPPGARVQVTGFVVRSGFVVMAIPPVSVKVTVPDAVMFPPPTGRDIVGALIITLPAVAVMVPTLILLFDMTLNTGPVAVPFNVPTVPSVSGIPLLPIEVPLRVSGMVAVVEIPPVPVMVPAVAFNVSGPLKEKADVSVIVGDDTFREAPVIPAP